MLTGQCYAQLARRSQRILHFLRELQSYQMCLLIKHSVLFLSHGTSLNVFRCQKLKLAELRLKQPSLVVKDW